MKIAIYSSLGLFLLWLGIVITSVWYPFLPPNIFFILTLSIAILLIILIIAFIVIAESRSEKKNE